MGTNRTSCTTNKLKRALTDDDNSAPKRCKTPVQTAAEIKELLPKKISERHLVIDESKKLGEGARAAVYQGTYRGMQVAVKKVESEPKTDDYFVPQQVAIMTELSKLDAPNVVRLYAYTSTVLPYYLVMPLMQNGSLADYIESPSNDRLSASLCFEILSGVAGALAFMHRYLLIHSDVKAENVLLDEKLVPCLADFDSAAKLDPGTMAIQVGPTKIRGTLMYLAPELLRRETYTTASDVYAFAILMWEVMAWKLYGEETNWLSVPEVVGSVLNGYREVIPENCPVTVAALIKCGWHSDKSQRPSMSKVQEELEVEKERLSLK